MEDIAAELNCFGCCFNLVFVLGLGFRFFSTARLPFFGGKVSVYKGFRFSPAGRFCGDGDRRYVLF